MNEGVVLGHHFSSRGIEVDQNKVNIIKHMPTPLKQKYVRSFLGHAIYYRRFIKDFTKLDSPMFYLFYKDIYFCWRPQCQNVMHPTTR
jgi:hypothetical protein